MMKGKQKVVEVRNYIESCIFEYGSFVKIQRPKYRIKSHIHTMHAAPPLSGGTSLARNKQTRFVPFEATFFFLWNKVFSLVSSTNLRYKYSSEYVD